MIPSYLEKEILIIGCGNLLFGDDGFGYFVIEKLKEKLNDKLKEKVALLDAGAGASSILDLVEDSKVKKIIVVDAIDFNLKPGEIKILTPDELPDDSLGLDAHGIPLTEKIKKLYNKGFKIKVVGCQVKYVPAPEPYIGLSKEVEEAVDKAVELIIKEVDNLW
ncbi:coenzyme F420-reducing hydrogenase, FrhD protein [Methanocaldococcus infernus]